MLVTSAGVLARNSVAVSCCRCVVLPELALGLDSGFALGQRLPAKLSNRKADQQADEREQEQRCGVAPLIHREPAGGARQNVRAGKGAAERREKARSKAAEPGRDDDRDGQRRQMGIARLRAVEGNSRRRRL